MAGAWPRLSAWSAASSVIPPRRHHADHLEPLEALAEQEERGDRRDRGELRREHGGDRDALAGGDDVDGAAEDLQDAGDGDERKGRPGQPEAAGQQQRQRDRQRADRPRDDHHPGRRDARGAEPPRQDEPDGEGERSRDREDHGSAVSSRVEGLLGVGRGTLGGGEDDAKCDRPEEQGRRELERLAEQDRDQGRKGALGRHDGSDDRDPSDRERGVREQQPEVVRDADGQQRGDLEGVEVGRAREDRRTDRRGQADRHHPAEDRHRADHPAGPRRGEGGDGPREGGGKAAEDRHHRAGSLTDRHGRTPTGAFPADQD